MKVRELMAVLYECDPEADVMPYTEWLDEVGDYKYATDDLQVYNPNGVLYCFINLNWKRKEGNNNVVLEERTGIG